MYTKEICPECFAHCNMKTKTKFTLHVFCKVGLLLAYFM